MERITNLLLTWSVPSEASRGGELNVQTLAARLVVEKNGWACQAPVMLFQYRLLSGSAELLGSSWTLTNTALTDEEEPLTMGSTAVPVIEASDVVIASSGPGGETMTAVDIVAS